jgi:hypothetical protein
MAIVNVGSFFFNTDNIVTMNIDEEDNGCILRVESDQVEDEVFIPNVTDEQFAAALRHGLTMEPVFNLMFYIDKIKAFRGEKFIV